MRPPIKKTCPKCGGSGKIDYEPNHEGDIVMNQYGESWDDCSTCIDGQVYNYKTPEQ